MTAQTPAREARHASLERAALAQRDARSARREALLARMGRPILLGGVGVRARTLPGYGVAFRQDSTFLYLVGPAGPGAYAWIDERGTTLFLPPTPPGDALWHGPSPSPAARAAALGVDRVADLVDLPALVQRARPAVLAVPDEAVNRQLTAWTGVPLAFGQHHGDAELVHAIIELRRTKDAADVAALREAAEATVAAHRLTMAATRPGVSERALFAVFRAALDARGAVEGYDTILTQRGEILHHHGHEGVCADGALLLCDGGGESLATGFTADVTRTWPVSGRFSPRQRAAYDAVLAGHAAALTAAQPGARWRDVHLASALPIAHFLVDEGLLRDISAEDAVAEGAHALFYPHGVGHFLGLDVHDLEAYGDLATYPPGARRSAQFGLNHLRVDLPLEAGWVMTVEPGFYVVAEILADPALRAGPGRWLHGDTAAAWVGFGGIRIEDDVLITRDGPLVLTDGLPRAADEVEALVGTADLSAVWEGAA